MSLSRIMVATDHSETAQRAEQFAGQLASADRTLQVTLLYVHPEQPVTIGRTGVEDVRVPAERLSAEDRAQMEATLGAAAERIGQAAGGNEVKIAEILMGSSDIGGTIALEAEKAGVEAIVMGSRGRSDIGALLLGSTSHKVLHLAHCPVIVVR